MNGLTEFFTIFASVMGCLKLTYHYPQIRVLRTRKPGRSCEENRAQWFTTMDPLAEKYPWISPYCAFANNPIRYVDPDGRDIWEFDEYGKFIQKVENKDYDAFRIMDANGNKVAGTDNFAYGTVKHNTPTVKVDGQLTRLDIFNISGNVNATQTFEMFANNTNTEWTHAKIGKEGSENNIVGTSQSTESTAVGHYLRQTNYTLREVIHNHPSASPFPSGTDLRGAEFYESSKNSSSATLNIYTSKYGYSPYNKSGTLDSRFTFKEGKWYYTPK